MTPPAGFQGIAAFVHAVEAKSFTLAAERLGVSKSAVGKSIARLEERLGVRLLNRTTRSLGLTPDGAAFHESCLRALAELEAAQALLAARRRVPSGRLRVDLPVSFGRRCLAPILYELAGLYPELSLEISFTDRRSDLVEEGIDLAIRMGPLDDSAGLIARRLYVQRSAVWAAPSYLDAKGRPGSIDDLARHSCITYARGGRVSPWQLTAPDGRVRSITPRSRIALGHGEAVLDAALLGHGLTYLPTWLTAEHARRGELEMVLSPTIVDDLVVHALWPRARDLVPKVRTAVDALVARFTPTPEWDRPV